jgi:hypothetical protein
METANKSFASIQLSLKYVEPVFKTLSQKLECVTPDKRPIIEELVGSQPKYESELNKVWIIDRSQDYLVSNKILGDLYLISRSDINELMEQLGCYYRELTIELFEVYIKCDFDMANTIATFQFRYN